MHELSFCYDFSPVPLIHYLYNAPRGTANIKLNQSNSHTQKKSTKSHQKEHLSFEYLMSTKMHHRTRVDDFVRLSQRVLAQHQNAMRSHINMSTVCRTMSTG